MDTRADIVVRDGTVVLLLDATFRADDLPHLRERVLSVLRHEGLVRVLVDLSRVEPSNLSGTLIRTHALTPRQAPMHVALVAPTPVLFGIARMYQLAASDQMGETRVFTNRDEAEEWLSEAVGALPASREK